MLKLCKLINLLIRLFELQMDLFYPYVVKKLEENNNSVINCITYDDTNDNTKCGTSFAFLTAQIYNLYRINLDSYEVVQKRKCHQIIQSNKNGFFEIHINNRHMKNQLIYGHVILVHKISKNKYRVYQSFITHYTLVEYLNTCGKIYTQKEITRWFNDMYKLQNACTSIFTLKRIYKTRFRVNLHDVGEKDTTTSYNVGIYFRAVTENDFNKHLVK